MKYFLGIDINEIDKDYKNTCISLDKIYTYNEYLSTLYFCHSNNTTCYIGFSSDKNTKFIGILFNNKNRIFLMYAYIIIREKMLIYILKMHHIIFTD